jgi:hypothetical protein
MGDVHLSRDVADFLRETVADDLRGAGHRVVDGGADEAVSGEVLRFWVRTDTTPLYWDVVAEIELRLSLTSALPGSRATTFSHSCEERQRTWVWPSLALVTGVLDACLERLVADVRSDPAWRAPLAFPRTAAPPSARIPSGRGGAAARIGAAGP